MSALREADFQPQIFHLQKCLGIATRVVDRIVSVFRLSKMLEVYERIFLHALVQRSEICRAETEGVFTDEVVEVPVDELPIESIIVRDEHDTPLAVGRQPFVELFHDAFRVVEFEALVSCESADSERVRDELFGDRFELPVKRAVQFRFDDHRTEADHRVVARNRTIGFNVNHDIRHRMSFLETVLDQRTN